MINRVKTFDTPTRFTIFRELAISLVCNPLSIKTLQLWFIFWLSLVFSYPVFAKYEEHLSVREESGIHVMISQWVYESI